MVSASVRALATCRFALRLNVLATCVSIPDFLVSGDAAVSLAICGAVIDCGSSTSTAGLGDGGGRTVVRCGPFSGK